ncbi:GNAT family N-acetyltransferase [Hwanghaeella grinnelliae]|uniref:GNAT family N-acetyltransferase n=1 Tax=Hwanghaeella grinnelliae TaxID=2500179 RepID=UPI001386A0A0|nr:GNAT family N-acetyltransferase [Hwanghaeella grinnelliae]
MAEVSLDEVVLRSAEPSESAALKAMGEALLAETPFFHRLPAERAASVGEMEHVIHSVLAAPGCALINAWHGDRPVGECLLVGGQLNRIRHTATVGIGVLQAYQGIGIGQALMRDAVARARSAGIVRLELTVMVPNVRAIEFYERFGFEVEGRKRASVMIDGEPVDELLMATILAP